MRSMAQLHSTALTLKAVITLKHHTTVTTDNTACVGIVIRLCVCVKGCAGEYSEGQREYIGCIVIGG